MMNIKTAIQVIRLRSKYLALGLVCLLMPAFGGANLPPLPPPTLIIPAAPTVSAKSYLLIDYLSDSVLAQKDIDLPVEPASLTKMMTVYVVDHALHEGKIKLTDPIHVSAKAWKAQGSRMFLQVDTDVSVQDLLLGIIIQSGNDASIAIAEHIAGSESAFAELMNYFAKQLGMTQTHFVNVTGLPDPNHVTTARDMAILAKAIIRDFPETYKMYAQKEFLYQNIKQTNRNRLLWRNDMVDGIKTGHTDNAGYCLVASGAKKDGMRLIAVVMGAKSDAARVDDTNALLTYGFRFFETRKLYSAGTSVKQSRIWMGTEKEVTLGLKDDFYITVAQGQYDKLKATVTVANIIKAPAPQNAELGSLQVHLNDKLLAERPVVALTAVPEGGFLSRLYDRLALAIQLLWDKLVG
jgi:serine-type D-Ala-D-Ala carboxypeptidase (penicillin-binding protein 5/6)